MAIQDHPAQTNASLDAPDAPNPYTRIVGSLEESIERVDRIQNQISTVDSRLHGNVPEPSGPDNSKVAAEPNGFIEVVQNLLARLNNAVNLAENNIEQLVRRVDI